MPGLGFVAAGYRAHSVAAPVLGFRYYGPVEGRVVAVDRSFSDRDPCHARPGRSGTRRGRTHARARPRGVARRRGTGAWLDDDRHGASQPAGRAGGAGGFDFQRLAWFDGLGAVGYSRSPALRLAPPEPRALPIARLRAAISVAVQKAIGGEAGGFGAAVLTGDRSGIRRATVEALRGSNLSHLLAISGLHMGLLTGFVFAALRYGLALIPAVALRLPVRKVAAAVSLVAAAFYLALSGGNVATERAFVMVSVMLVAVLADRRALSLRSVATAAILILLAQPEMPAGAGVSDVLHRDDRAGRGLWHVA
ncbi:MAG: ComEC/Rec2 family competence protein [Paracoccaceae bacterium]